MTLPTLTPQITAQRNAATTAAADVVAALKATINDCIGTTSNWTAADATGNAAGTPACLLSAPSTSPISAFRAILGIDTAASGALYSSPDVYSSGLGLADIGPDGITGSNNWYHATLPFGTGKRVSGLSRWFPATVGTKTWCLATEETIWIQLRGANDQSLCCVGLGALWEPANAASAEADGRLYGMIVSGGTGYISTTMHTVVGSNVFLRHGATAGNAHGIFYDPVSASWKNCSWRGYQSAPGASDSDSAQTLDGKTYCQDMMFHVGTGSNIGPRLGKLRGVYEIGVKACRGTVQNSALVTKGYAISGDLASAVDAIAVMAA